MTAHILVVDDNQPCTEAIGLLLQNAGYQVSVARYFTDALAILECAPPPDLLITDIVMPNSVNGAALARMARMCNPSIRVVYITGYDIPGIDRKTFGPLLRKPLADDQLLTTIATELSRKPSGSASV